METKDHKVKLETKVILDLLENLANQEKLAKLDLRDHRVKLEILDSL